MGVCCSVCFVAWCFVFPLSLLLRWYVFFVLSCLFLVVTFLAYWFLSIAGDLVCFFVFLPSSDCIVPLSLLSLPSPYFCPFSVPPSCSRLCAFPAPSLLLLSLSFFPSPFAHHLYPPSSPPRPASVLPPPAIALPGYPPFPLLPRCLPPEASLR